MSVRYCDRLHGPCTSPELCPPTRCRHADCNEARDGDGPPCPICRAPLPGQGPCRYCRPVISEEVRR